MGSTQERLETGFRLLTVRKERSGFGLSFQTVQRTGHPHPLPRFWDWKLGPAKAHYLWWPTAWEEPHI